MFKELLNLIILFLAMGFLYWCGLSKESNPKLYKIGQYSFFLLVIAGLIFMLISLLTDIIPLFYQPSGD